MTQVQDVPRTTAGTGARAVAWLARHADHLDPALADPSTELFARKALVEVALLVGLRARLDPTPLDADHARLLDVVAEVAARPSYRELAARDRRALLLYAGTYAALRLCGREDLAFRHVLERAVRGRYATVFERVPYRHLDLLHTLELAGLPSDVAGLGTALPLTVLTGDPNVLELSTADTYAITHAVFYASDFGCRDVPWPAGSDAERAPELLRACLALARARQDADLVGELLMCLTCLGAGPSPADDDARAWLRAWQEPDGRVEGPQGVVPDRLTQADPAWSRWATAYHTTIVAALEDLLHRHAPVAHRGRARGVLDGARPVWVRHAHDGAPGASAVGTSAVDVPAVDVPAVDVRGAVRDAAGWLDAHVPATDLRAAAWTVEARAALGDVATARSRLGGALAGDDVAGRLAAVPGDVGLHVAELAARLGDGAARSSTCVVVPLPAPLRALLTTVEDVLADVPVTDTTVDGARERVAAARGGRWWTGYVESLAGVDDGPDAAAEPDDPDARRARALALAADLVRRGRSPHVAPGTAARAASVLVRAAADAVAAYDVGVLAVVVRGLVRLPAVPRRVVRDAVEWLVGQQQLTGGVGAPLGDDPAERDELVAQWTLLALPALLEGAALA
ncbi:hypothetical protein H9657_16235 [Cellulomonas sp. Sa3CUA2]|uniref:DUF6895 domain-containing protein n=1 Tax=Cellulomonas avistercoris TaxID=2762242 RepID=A0ABR8QHB6_9CELL|nr:hypothetical protein [Cellulomonas avistercoris]MBD7919821.1 hypothetical protein [Cellulomonas avistercoris]